LAEAGPCPHRAALHGVVVLFHPRSNHLSWDCLPRGGVCRTGRAGCLSWLTTA